MKEVIAKALDAVKSKMDISNASQVAEVVECYNEGINSIKNINDVKAFMKVQTEDLAECMKTINKNTTILKIFTGFSMGISIVLLAMKLLNVRKECKKIDNKYTTIKKQSLISKLFSR